MRPECFKTKPNASNAQKLHKIWKYTFTIYFQTVAVARNIRTMETLIIHKKHLIMETLIIHKKLLLFQILSPQMFLRLPVTYNFNRAIQVLDHPCIKPTNTEYIRHQFIIFKQE